MVVDMVRRTEQAALLALLRDRRDGWSAVADDVEICGSAYELLVEGRPGTQGELFGAERAPTERLDAALTAIDRWEAAGLSLVTLLDEDYPGQLLTIHQRPPFLFYQGTLSAEDADGVAVVGTRRPSEAGLQKAADIASGLAHRDVPVISGLASGIDTAAHRGALDAGGRTVAVLGTGVQRTYPAENEELQAELARSRLILSQFWPDAAPSKKSFPMRNAVMSGYAAATVVVEASGQSGARMQARLALQHGRPVFLLDDLLRHDWAREYADLPGTTVVSGPEDIFNQLSEVIRPAEQLVWA